MSPNPQGTADLVTFNEEILNDKLHFLCSVSRTPVKPQAEIERAQKLSLGSVK